MTSPRPQWRRRVAAAVTVTMTTTALVAASPAAVQASGKPGLTTWPEQVGYSVYLGSVDVAARRSPRLSVMLDGDSGDTYAYVQTVTVSSGRSDAGNCVGYDISRLRSCDVTLLDPSGVPGERTDYVCVEYRTGPRHAPGPQQRWCTNLRWWAVSKPGVPGLTAEPGPDAGQVTLTWSRPDDTGGGPFWFGAGLYDDDDDPWDGDGPSWHYVVGDGRERQQLVVADLAAGRRLYALGSVGNGVHFSGVTRQSYVTVPGLPGPPEPVQVRRRLGGPVELQWSLPATDGGGTVLHYEVYRVDGGTRRLVTRTPLLTASDDPGLPAVGTYTYVVAAVTRFGRGPDSKPVTAPVVSGL